MARNYRHISNYEKEIIELKKEGKSNREICEIYGFEIKQLKTSSTDTIVNKIK